MTGRVTITGADDAVDHEDLVALSAEFPFVEWAILVSATRGGEPRYPSRLWFRELQNLAWSSGIALAAHLCGPRAREFLAHPFGGGGPLDGIGRAVRRIQLNGHEPGRRHFIDGQIRYDHRWILQCRSAESLKRVSEDARDIENCDVLFDPSGGRGLTPASWPSAPPGTRMGYAGGITPDNVLDVLEAIGPRGPDTWIDMESGVRTDDRFDLTKVGEVLEVVGASGWLEGAAVR